MKFLKHLFLGFLLRIDDGRRQKIVLFELKAQNLIVYYLAETPYIKYIMGDATLYWRDQVDPNGWGPFTNLNTLTYHYEATLGARKRAVLVVIPVVQAKVVHVDFKNKKKIITQLT